MFMSYFLPFARVFVSVWARGRGAGAFTVLLVGGSLSKGHWYRYVSGAWGFIGPGSREAGQRNA